MNTFDLDRRHVIKSIALTGGSALLIFNDSATLSETEGEWEKIRAAFVRQEPLINLNNAAVSPPTLATEAAVIKAFRFANKNPDVNMWRTLDNSLIDIKGFKLHTPLDHPGTGGLALFSIEGVRPEHIEKRLLDDFKIRVRYRRNMHLEGVRVSPHIYTMTSDLDHFETPVIGGMSA